MSRVRQSDRGFGLMFSGVFAIVFAVFYVAFDELLIWALIVSVVFAVLALVMPGVLLPLTRLWGSFADKLGRINNFLILSLFYFLFVVPVGVVLRLFGRDPMTRRLSADAASYWSTPDRKTTPETLKDMF